MDAIAESLPACYDANSDSGNDYNDEDLALEIEGALLAAEEKEIEDATVEFADDFLGKCEREPSDVVATSAICRLAPAPSSATTREAPAHGAPSPSLLWPVAAAKRLRSHEQPAAVARAHGRALSPPALVGGASAAGVHGPIEGASTRPVANASGEAQQHPVASASAAEAYAASVALRSGAGELALFPPEVLHHMLRFLSPEDLTTCARVCKYLAHMTLDAALWRHLYCLRWNAPGSAAHGKGGPAATSAKNGNWKKMYFELDRGEMADAVADAPEEMKEYMAQMQRARRTQAPTRAQVAQDDSLLLHNTSVGEEIASWRARHGFVGAQAARRAADHLDCAGTSCSYHVIADVFLCEQTGRAHVCDETCREMVVDPSNELMVCPVSGRTSELWLGEGEGNTGVGYGSDKEAEEEGEGEDMAGGPGRLARAFWLGYYCKNERELDSKLGRAAASGIKN